MTRHRQTPTTVRQRDLRPALVALALAGAAVGAARAADRQPDSYVGISLGAGVVVPRGVSGGEASTDRLSPGLFIGTRIGGLPVGSSTWPLSAEVGHQRIAWSDVSYAVGTGRADLRTRGFATYAAVKLDAPINDAFAVYGKLGLSRNHADGSVPAGQTAVDIDGSRTGLMSALGVQYHLTPEFTLRTELVSYGKASANARAGGAQVGLGYRF